MSEYPFDWVDAFTGTAFAGNGCAVVYDEGELSSDVCLRYTKETGLVECTFIGPSDVADLKVRYFLASHEIAFAGHPTVASVRSALARGRVSGPRLTLETGAGIITVDVSDDNWITMTQNAPVFGQVVPLERVAEVVGLDENDIVGLPQVVSTGLPFVITVVRDHAALRRAKMNASAMEAFQNAVSFEGKPVMEPYLVSLNGATAEGDTFSRLLMKPPSPKEDPFTGSATGCAAAYLWHHGLIKSPSYCAEQGHDMGRPGMARVEVLGPRDAITGVKVAGQGRIVMRGTMLP